MCLGACVSLSNRYGGAPGRACGWLMGRQCRARSRGRGSNGRAGALSGKTRGLSVGRGGAGQTDGEQDTGGRGLGIVWAKQEGGYIGWYGEAAV